jgi:biopolymer transport protein ExbD
VSRVAEAAIPMPEQETQFAPPEETEAVGFRTMERSEEDELDMTPMVDVTFLLLIFFMVTAAYSLQKSIEIPAPDREEDATQARTIEEVEQDDDYVIIRIDADNTIWVNDSEVPPLNKQEILVKLRAAREAGPGSDSLGPSSLLVLADPDCRHETVVMALDAGNAVGMENVRLATADETQY